MQINRKDVKFGKHLGLVLKALVKLPTNFVPLSEEALTCRVDNVQSSCVRLVCRQLRLKLCENPTLVMRNPGHPCRLSCRERARGSGRGERHPRKVWPVLRFQYLDYLVSWQILWSFATTLFGTNSDYPIFLRICPMLKYSELKFIIYKIWNSWQKYFGFTTNSIYFVEKSTDNERNT